MGDEKYVDYEINEVNFRYQTHEYNFYRMNE